MDFLISIDNLIEEVDKSPLTVRQQFKRKFNQARIKVKNIPKKITIKKERLRRNIKFLHDEVGKEAIRQTGKDYIGSVGHIRDMISKKGSDLKRTLSEPGDPNKSTIENLKNKGYSAIGQLLTPSNISGRQAAAVGQLGSIATAVLSPSLKHLSAAGAIASATGAYNYVKIAKEKGLLNNINDKRKAAERQIKLLKQQREKTLIQKAADKLQQTGENIRQHLVTPKDEQQGSNNGNLIKQHEKDSGLVASRYQRMDLDKKLMERIDKNNLTPEHKKYLQSQGLMESVFYLLELLDTHHTNDSKLVSDRLWWREVKNTLVKPGMVVGLGAAGGEIFDNVFKDITGSDSNLLSKIINRQTATAATIAYSMHNIAQTKFLLKKFTNDLGPKSKEAYELLNDTYQTMTNIALGMGTDFSLDDISLFLEQYESIYKQAKTRQDKVQVYIEQMTKMLKLLKEYNDNKYFNKEVEFLYIKSLMPRFEKLKHDLSKN